MTSLNLSAAALRSMSMLLCIRVQGREWQELCTDSFEESAKFIWSEQTADTQVLYSSDLVGTTLNHG